jgi:chorismate mutase
MPVRGIRGASVVERDNPEEILEATNELLEMILMKNPDMKATDIASVFFTLTSDLKTVHPAKAARELGWHLVPLMCASEIPVPNSLPRCIRVLIHWNTDKNQSEIKHVYLKNAALLRPDL